MLVYFWEPSGPSRARMRTNTEVCLALPSAKPSLPRGLLRGEPPNVPKKVANVFSKYFRLDPKLLVSLEKQTRGVSNYGTGPAESWGRLRLWDMAPPHYPTPTLLMNAKFLADVYLSRIREHGNKVKKMRARTHKTSMGHTVNFNDNEIPYL